MQMRASMALSIALAFVLLLLLAYLFTGLMTGALAKLHISQAAAGQLVLAIILGGFINIPITRLSQPQELAANPIAMYGLDRLFPSLYRQPRETVIAVNLGGCIIPLGIAIYQLTHIAGQTPELLPKTSIVVGVTTMVCYFIAPLWPASASRCPVSSAAAALLLVPSEAPPVAFVAGSSDRCWGQICCTWPTCGGSELAWPASGERGRSMASYSQELLPPISPEPHISSPQCGCQARLL